jgi:hypothetical protein
MTGLSLPDEAGHFMLILQRATLPRFASDNRMSSTAEENKAVVQGSIAYLFAGFASAMTLEMTLAAKDFPVFLAENLRSTQRNNSLE